MIEQTQWKESKITIRGNQYFHYPQDENEFKNEVVKGGGWIAHIHKNGAFVDKVEADSSVIWQAPIFTNIKTTKRNNKDIEQIYENCKFYAVPKGYEDMLPPKQNINYWIFPSNPSQFDSIACFKAKQQDWWVRHLQNKKANVGDIAFLYITKTDDKYSQSIAIQTRIIEVDESSDRFDNGSFLLELVKFFDTPIPFDFLQKIGINGNIQGTRNITKEQAHSILNYKGETMPPTELNNANNKTPPLNQILYGPPGTGKTYSTIDRALEILHHYDESMQIPKSREDKKAIFEHYRTNGQIAFVTFHQSFSYEEFVEGIKPKLIDSSDGLESSKMEYEIKSGIFKQICDIAKQNTKEFVISQQAIKPYVLDKSKTLWRLYTLPDANIENDFFDECIENKYVKAYYNYGGVALNKAQNGDYIVIPSTNYAEMSKTIRAFGILSSNDDKQTQENEIYYRNVEWLWIAKDENEIIRFDKVNFNRPTFQRVKQGKETIIDYMNILLDKNKESFTTKPYILIIDEINRGNIAKILGELITLIEPSKRIGGDEELRVTLPYSNETFGVPSNLYIIGTMNTADRSIALLDTALRRRFEFVEMMPDCSILSENCDGVNLRKLLQYINARIEFLLDREHTIGHSFFIGVDSMGDLREVFGLKIIPLLQEYFYDDYAKISAVLNHNGMIKAFSQGDLGVNLSDDFVDNEKRVYRISDSHLWDIETFTKIYQSNDSRESSDNE